MASGDQTTIGRALPSSGSTMRCEVRDGKLVPANPQAPQQTTDLPARLRIGADRIEAARGDAVWASDVLAPDLREAAARIEKLEAAMMRQVQRLNDCAATGKSCREDRRCGCWLEMQDQTDE